MEKFILEKNNRCDILKTIQEELFKDKDALSISFNNSKISKIQDITISNDDYNIYLTYSYHDDGIYANIIIHIGDVITITDNIISIHKISKPGCGNTILIYINYKGE
jgi:uncharacterized protein YjaG (DUF416 family)